MGGMPRRNRRLGEIMTKIGLWTAKSLEWPLNVITLTGFSAFMAVALKHGRRTIGIGRSETAINVARNRAELARVPLVKINP